MRQKIDYNIGMPTQKTSKHYQHQERAILRPESGAQDVFPANKRLSPKEYRFDSSLSPELMWDENTERANAEQLLAKIADADSLEDAKAAAAELRTRAAPFLNWTGKAERDRFFVPSLPLFVHERLSTDAVLKTLERHKRKRTTTLELFGEGQKSIGDAISGAYQHSNGWQNRMILGDSLQVMNSLLTYEQMGGKVQMAYIDPPYGVKFGSNFMPFVRKREVKDGDDADITREPEMVQAYRDTWQLGIHSWLTYMRDRLLLTRDLLTDSGSCFVQISDENVHLARSIMDEIFGRENFVNQIGFRTCMTKPTKKLNNVFDYILWYAKDKERMKFHELFLDRNMSELDEDFIGTSALFASAPQPKFEFEFEGKLYNPKNGWRVTQKGLEILAKKGRLHASGTLRYKNYASDFPCVQLDNIWNTMMSEQNKKYVVQTSEKVIQRCMLMTTSPGDLVFDPTCGGGTTAVVAEQWGRRWITADVSRVPLALARERLLTTIYDYYQLKHEPSGPAGGFVYTRKQNPEGKEIGGIVPHTTLKSIVNNEPMTEEVLVDKPETDSQLVRITGPFCVEAVMPPPLSATEQQAVPDDDNHITRMIQILVQSPKLQLADNKTLTLKNTRPPAKSMNLHAEAEADNNPVAIIFGAPNSSVSERTVIDAAREARHKDFLQLIVIAFAIEPSARTTIEKMKKLAGISATYVQASLDLTMGDLLKNMRSSQIFAVCGQPDVRLSATEEKNKNGDLLYQVQLIGLDTFDPTTMTTESKSGKDVPCWMLDPDYDGQCFRAGQIFFPRTEAWNKIREAIKADFAEEVWTHLSGDTSAPFAIGEGEKIAIKVIDDRGNELIVVKSIEEAE